MTIEVSEIENDIVSESNGRTILVIDDEPSVRDIFSQYFTRFGYQVESAKDGKEGLKKCSELKVDIVITDLYMPNVDGLECLLKLTETYPNILTFAISGGGSMRESSHLKTAKYFGAHQVFQKPVCLKSLRRSIEETLMTDAS